jgi:hypothetical protein
VPARPTGSFSPADIQLDTAQVVTIELQAEHVPVGTTIDVLVVNETNPAISAVSTPLNGTEDLSTASATVTIPAGFSRIYSHADWAP